jgi:hypothetical protein
MKGELPVMFRCAGVSLNVHSYLNAVGLTPAHAHAKALGDQGIGCNGVAGAHHDHLLVPIEFVNKAQATPSQLQVSER